MAPVSRGSGRGCFLLTQLASWCQHAPRPAPTGVSCLCGASPAPSPGDSLAGGEEVISCSRLWSPPRAGPAAPAGSQHLAWRAASGDLRRPRRTRGHRRLVTRGLGACEPSGTSWPPRARLCRPIQRMPSHTRYPSFLSCSSLLLPLSRVPSLQFLFFCLLRSSLLELYKYLLSADCVPGPTLGTEDTVMEAVRTSALEEVTFH